jgi:hypothetical protein
MSEQGAQNREDILQEQADIVMLKPVSPARLRQIAARFA